MNVIKRDGRVQKFNINKIKLTLEKVSDELHEPLTLSDIENLGKSIKSSVERRNEKAIKSNDVFRIVIEELQNSGFTHIAQVYKEYQKGFEKVVE